MHDDKGFSLVELIIVMAISAVLLGVAWYGINSLSGKQVNEYVNNLESYLGKTRAYTLAFAKNTVQMELSHTADGYYVTTYHGGTAEESRKIGNPSLTVSYYTGESSKVELAEGVTLKLSFKRDSGAFNPISGEAYCEKIEVAKGGKTVNLVMVAATGKYYTQ